MKKKLKIIFDKCSELMNTVHTSPLPIIAMTHGVAAAAGLQLACACDLITSTSTCQFSTPGINVGLFCSTPAVELIRTISRKHATEMLLTGKPIDAKRAYEIGLINKMTNTNTNNNNTNNNNNEDKHENAKKEMNELHLITEELALQIIDKSKSVTSMGKRGFYKQIELNLHDAHNIAGDCMVENLHLNDGKEGLSSFIEKRKPTWTDS